MDVRRSIQELNLVEFPITLLVDRVPSSVKTTLTFEDNFYDTASQRWIPRKLEIEPGAKSGFPTPADGDVYQALVHLTHVKTGFKGEGRRLWFSRYELLNLLGWELCGPNYKRISQSIERWHTVSLRYSLAWKREGKWDSTAGFHILEDFHLNPESGRNLVEGRDEPTSFIVWSEIVWGSYSNNYVMPLDLDVYWSLKSAITKRMYAFLGKWFYHGKDRVYFDLQVFAFHKIGISHLKDNAQIRRRLDPSIQELEKIQFLAPLLPFERYEKVSGKAPQIIFVRFTQEQTITNPAIEILINFGVQSRQRAAEAASLRSVSFIEDAIAHIEYRRKTDFKGMESPAGLLIKNLLDRGYEVPTKFVGSSEKRRLEEERQVSALSRTTEQQLSRFQENRLHDKEKEIKERIGPEGIKALKSQIASETGLSETNITSRLQIAGLLSDRVRRMAEGELL
jgi:hypothetical protein